jgi:hypothetical protein
MKKRRWTGQPLGRRAALGDVAPDDDPMAGLPAGARERHDLELHQEGFAGPRIARQFGIAGLAGAHRLDDACELRAAGFRSLQQAQVAAFHLGARIAAAAQEGVVDEGDRGQRRVVVAGGVQARHGGRGQFQLGQRTGQSLEQRGAGERQQQADGAVVDDRDQRGLERFLLPARHAQAHVADRAQRDQRHRAQGQRQQRRTQAQQDGRDQGRPQQVAQAGRSDVQGQDDRQQVDHSQEVRDAYRVRQVLQAPDDEYPGQGDRVGQCHRPHAFLQQEGRDQEG